MVVCATNSSRALSALNASKRISCDWVRDVIFHCNFIVPHWRPHHFPHSILFALGIVLAAIAEWNANWISELFFFSLFIRDDHPWSHPISARCFQITYSIQFINNKLNSHSLPLYAPHRRALIDKCCTTIMRGALHMRIYGRWKSVLMALRHSSDANISTNNS